MRKIATIMFLGVSLTLGLEVITPRVSQAQLFYPQASDRNSVMVIGQGVVKVPADNADIELLITKSSLPSLEDDTESLPSLPLPPLPQESESVSVPTILLQRKNRVKLVQSQTGQLTENNLQPLIDTIVKQGISSDQVRLQLSEDPEENKAKIFIRVENPTTQKVKQLVNSLKKTTADLDDISIEKVGVEYTVNDCLALQSAAYKAAAEDAKNRAQALADAMDLRLGKPSVSEPFYTLLYASCSTKAFTLPSFASFLLSSDFDPDKPAEVEMKKDIFVSFSVR